MKTTKRRHLGPQSRKCPPGKVMVNGKCVERKSQTKTGIPVMPDAPTRGIVLSEDKCAIILQFGKVLLNWASLRKTSPLFGLDVRKPLYLVSQKKNGSTQAVGIVVARNIDGDSKTRITLRRAFKPGRNINLKQKPVDLMVRKRDMQFIRAVIAEPAKGGLLPPGSDSLIDVREGNFIPKAALENLGKETSGLVSLTFSDTKKVLSESVGNPSSEGGQHSHSLIRSEGRTMNSGEHFHILDHPEFGRLVSDIDGQHPHTLDGDTTGSEASPHSHVFGLPSGEMLRTEVDGPHDHDVLSRRTDNGGVHVHKIKVDGQTLQTLSATEEAMEMGPGLGDPKDEDDASNLPGEMGLVEASAKHLDAIDVDFEKVWQEADEWTLKTMVEKQTTVQSVVLAKTRFPAVEAAKEWVIEHGFKADKVDEKPNTFRFRQFPPGRCKDGTFRNKRITRGVIAVICVLKGDETPSGLKHKAGNERARQIQKQVLEHSTVRVDSNPTGFTFELKDDNILFAFKDSVVGQATGQTIAVVVRQRLGVDGMDKAPTGAVDAMEIEIGEEKKPAKELAKENLGNLIILLEAVKGTKRFREAGAFMAVLDPTKGAPDNP